MSSSTNRSQTLLNGSVTFLAAFVSADACGHYYWPALGVRAFGVEAVLFRVGIGSRTGVTVCSVTLVGGDLLAGANAALFVGGGVSIGMGQTLLVPQDDSSQSEVAFEYVLQYLPKPGLILVHVINPIGAFANTDDEYLDPEVYRSVQRKRREQAETFLEEYATEARDHGLEIETIVTTRKLAGKILKVAEERDVDHIVMGSHGRSGVSRVVFGSVAETVTRCAATLVTIVR